jgi:8-oxo-dGTP pyrophosphatase MutT (NUDIX family)
MTALRETEEELAIRASDVRLIGRLNDYLTITNYQIAPIIGAIPWPYPITPDKREVTRAFTIPLAWLSDPENYEERCRELPQPYDPVPVIHYKQYQGETLWGVSARIMIGLIDVLQSPP